MKQRIVKSIVSLALVVGLITAYIPFAASVVKNVNVISSTGEPVARQKITISFPPGVTDSQGNTSAEEETDDDGGFYFDFPDDGEYVIEYAGGSMTYVVKGGIPTYVKVGGALVALTGAYYLLDDDDDDDGEPGTSSSGTSSGTTSSSSSASSSSSSSGMTSSSSSSSGMTSSSSSSSSSSGGPPADPNGEYSLDTTTVDSNTANHPVAAFIQAVYIVSSLFCQVIIDNPGFSTSVTMTGTCDPSGTFSVSGDGTFSGFATDFWMTGNFDAELGTFSATLGAGNDGGLPENAPIDVSVTGSKTSP